MKAKIFDFDQDYIGEEVPFIIREVDQIEKKCKQHDNDIIWYNGFKSEVFELIK